MFLVKQMEAIKFVADWRKRGRQPGANKFKQSFTRSVYEHHMHQPLEELVVTPAGQKAYAEFKAAHRKYITARGYLYDLFKEVRVTFRIGYVCDC